MIWKLNNHIRNIINKNIDIPQITDTPNSKISNVSVIDSNKKSLYNNNKPNFSNNQSQWTINNNIELSNVIDTDSDSDIEPTIVDNELYITCDEHSPRLKD